MSETSAGIPQISREEFAARRRQLLDVLGDQAVAIVRAADLQVRNHDAEYPFRQNSDFLYLTGFNEPEAVAVFIPGREDGEFVLFCQEKDPLAERWTGIRAGTEGAVKDYGADQAFLLKELDSRLPELLKGRDEIHYRIGSDPVLDGKVIGWLQRLRAQARNGVAAPTRWWCWMRLCTIAPVQVRGGNRHDAACCGYGGRAHTRAMQVCQPGRFEFEIEAELLREFRRDGMEPAYTSIVGGGANACILHYVTNRCALRDGDLLLIDAGGEHHGYASDITRTSSGQWPFPAAAAPVVSGGAGCAGGGDCSRQAGQWLE
ncbi:MAG: aminopeptidase P N-terminal domain-containing protein [Thiolinea sp.]